MLTSERARIGCLQFGPPFLEVLRFNLCNVWLEKLAKYRFLVILWSSNNRQTRQTIWYLSFWKGFFLGNFLTGLPKLNGTCWERQLITYHEFNRHMSCWNFSKLFARCDATITWPLNFFVGHLNFEWHVHFAVFCLIGYCDVWQHYTWRATRCGPFQFVWEIHYEQTVTLVAKRMKGTSQVRIHWIKPEIRSILFSLSFSTLADCHWNSLEMKPLKMFSFY